MKEDFVLFTQLTEKMCDSQTLFFALVAAAAGDNDGNSFVSVPTEEQNFNLRGKSPGSFWRMVLDLCRRGLNYLSPKEEKEAPVVCPHVGGFTFSKLQIHFVASESLSYSEWLTEEHWDNHKLYNSMKKM